MVWSLKTSKQSALGGEVGGGRKLPAFCIESKEKNLEKTRRNGQFAVMSKEEVSVVLLHNRRCHLEEKCASGWPDFFLDLSLC